ncbi:MAG TPA: isoprenylcysteine carboxylmethyltransferase family protein [Rhizomicrobium sp.]
MPPGDQTGNLLLRLCLQTGVWLAIMTGLLLGGAENALWPQGLIYLAIFTLGSVVFGARMLKRDPGLLAARLGALNQKGQPVWDKLFLPIFIGSFLVWMWLMARDAQVWRLSHVPVWLNGVGVLLVLAGFAGVMRVFRENSFAAPVVRVQAERQQRVIDTGPYAHVRHPMYAAMLLYLTGLPLLLGSWWGLAGAAVIALAMARRAMAEEGVLVRELAGYADYRARVRYRLIPGIW